MDAWRAGTVTVGGVRALVAAMDSDNDAVFDKQGGAPLLRLHVIEAGAGVAEVEGVGRASFPHSSRIFFSSAWKRASPRTGSRNGNVLIGMTIGSRASIALSSQPSAASQSPSPT